LPQVVLNSLGRRCDSMFHTAARPEPDGIVASAM